MDIVVSDFSFEKTAIELDILLTVYYPYNLEALFTLWSTNLTAWLRNRDCKYRATKREIFILTKLRLVFRSTQKVERRVLSQCL